MDTITLGTPTGSSRIPAVAKEIREDVIVLCHGGPIAEPEDVQYIFENTKGIAGFFGASSVERLATERAIEAQARSFKELKL